MVAADSPDPASSRESGLSREEGAGELRAGAEQLGVMLDALAVERLLRLLDELAHWNRAYNLSAISGRQAMIRHHLLDSLAAQPHLQGTRVVDVGTGAGFPGLPLAIADPGRHYTLIDSNGKKIRFVSHAVRTLGLANVTVLHARAGAAGAAGPFDTVIARAFAALPELLHEVAPLCGDDGCVLAFKGRYPAAEVERLPAGWRLAGTHALVIPGLTAERHILRLEPQPV